MDVLASAKSGWARLIRLVLLLLASVLLLALLPFILIGVGLTWLWRSFTEWRLRRGFDAHFRPQGKRAVFVYSDSPHWKERIEEEVLPRIRDRVVLLNWSERSTERWRERPLEVRIFRRWSGSREFNPIAIVIPEKGPVRVIPFWQAYKDLGHGKPGPLREKEQELFDALGTPGPEHGQAP